MTPSTDDSLEGEHRRVDEICGAFLQALAFLVGDAGRDPAYVENHLLSYLFQDFLQSTIAIRFLVTQGMLSVSRRELRFVLEASIKIAYVQQAQYSSTIATKLEAFKIELNSPSISLKSRVSLPMIGEAHTPAFLAETGQVYGATSNYVHLTVSQILTQMAAVDAGKTTGRESAGDVQALSLLLARGFACALVFLLHSVPGYVAGDWLVDADGSTVDSYFTRSRWISIMDEHFDYKHERKSKLPEVIDARAKRVAF